MHRLCAECAVHIGRFRPPKTHRAAAHADREDDPEPGIWSAQNLLAKRAAIRRHYQAPGTKQLELDHDLASIGRASDTQGLHHAFEGEAMRNHKIELVSERG